MNKLLCADRTLDAFIGVEVGLAMNWLRWVSDTYSESSMHRKPLLLRQRDEAREVISEKCAAWFEVQS